MQGGGSGAESQRSMELATDQQIELIRRDVAANRAKVIAMLLETVETVAM